MSQGFALDIRHYKEGGVGLRDH